MSDALAAIVAAYRATRRKNWRQLRQVPLVHGIEALTRTGTPFALDPAEAGGDSSSAAAATDALDSFG